MMFTEKTLRETPGWKTTLIVFCAFALGACGGSGGSTSPTAPSASAPSVPYFGGSWSGQYNVTGCTETGVIALLDLCADLEGDDDSLALSMSLTQASRNVTGAFTVSDLVFPGSDGTVAPNGTLALSGTLKEDGVTIVADWTLTKSPESDMGGTLSLTFTGDGVSGQVKVVGQITAQR